MTRVDPVTADKVRQVLSSARARGADPAMALDQAHLLAYRRQELMVEIRVVERIINDLSAITADILPEHRARMTKLDMKQYILAFLESVREGLVRHADSDK